MNELYEAKPFQPVTVNADAEGLNQEWDYTVPTTA